MTRTRSETKRAGKSAGAPVITLVADPAGRGRIAEALRGHAEVAAVASVAELRRVAGLAMPRAVVFDLLDRHGRVATSTIRALRTRWPVLRLVAYAPVIHDVSRAIFVAGQEGVDDVIVRGTDTVMAIRRAILPEADGAVVRLVWRAVEAFIPKAIRPVLRHCLEQREARFTATALAAELGMHRRVLGDRLAMEGGPTPGRLVGWSRLLLAAGMMDLSPRSVESIAFSVGFSDAAALRNMLRRYTGLRTSQLPRGEAVAVLAGRFRGEWGGGGGGK